MIYFSRAPVRLDSVDNDQYSAVTAFKQSLRPKGLVEEYEDLSQFRTKFARQLAQTVINHFATRSEATINGVLLPVPVLPEPAPLPTLSEAARTLLVEASQDRDGVIMSLQTMEGVHVQTNGKEFSDGSVRSAARWKGAVRELHELNLVEDRAGKGEVFFVTDEGYLVAERLKLVVAAPRSE